MRHVLKAKYVLDFRFSVNFKMRFENSNLTPIHIYSEKPFFTIVNLISFNEKKKNIKICRPTLYSHDLKKQIITKKKKLNQEIRLNYYVIKSPAIQKASPICATQKK